MTLLVAFIVYMSLVATAIYLGWLVGFERSSGWTRRFRIILIQMGSA